MNGPDDARKYLADALRELGIDMAVASDAINKNHAYIQQYIKREKPRWLPEQVRDLLVRTYGLTATVFGCRQRRCESLGYGTIAPDEIARQAANRRPTTASSWMIAHAPASRPGSAFMIRERDLALRVVAAMAEDPPR
jgi:hypothetical protein